MTGKKENRRWSDEETAELLRMKAAKYPVNVISTKLGRSYSSCVERFRWVNKSEEKKQARREQINATRYRKRGAYTTTPHKLFGYSTVAGRPSKEMVEAAQARMMAPRTISQQMFGDPPPGYSALDRRGAPA